MSQFKVTLVAQTTEGRDFVTTDPMSLGEATDNVAGMIAAVGEDNVIGIMIKKVAE